ncbi:DUF1015 domain-containing protein [Bdellovibrionota bacterium]
MANVKPFVATHYDFSLHLDDLLVPPYDVISEEERKEFLKKDRHSFVQLLLGEGDNWHGGAGETLQNWQKDGTFIQDSEPSFYVSEEEFIHPGSGEKIVRRGFFAAVKVSPFKEKIILPHEKTHPGPKEDRLKLLKATKAHIDPIFGMFPTSDKISSIIKETTKSDSDIEFTDYAGVVHRLWKLSDSEKCKQITEALKDSSIYIIDGHHRYETSLFYSTERQNDEGVSDPKPYNRTLMCLVSMDDPGLICLPTHRILKEAPEGMLEKIEEFFEIKKIESEALLPLRDIHLVTKDGVYSLSPRNPEEDFYKQIPVVLLHKVIFENLLGMDEDKERQSVTYVKGGAGATKDAIDSARKGEIPALFLLPAITNEQVKKVADASLVFPQKSTFYVPKLLSGQVLFCFE